MTFKTQTILALNISLILQLLGTGLALYSDPYINRKHKRYLFINTLILLAVVLLEQAEYQASAAGFVKARLVFAILVYILRPLTIVLFMQIVSEDKRAFLAVAVNALVFLTAFFTDIAFTIRQDNSFHRGPLGYTCHVISVLLLVWLMYLTIRKYKGRRSREMLIPFIIPAVIVAATVADTWFSSGNGICLLTIVTVTACVLYYIWLHLQFVREHEQDLEARGRIRVMMSQIQPHFLYNTLSTIQALCASDPDKASDITGKFGIYLRQNIDTLSLPGLIAFDKELEHTRIYAEIEMTRFPSIRVEYDIQDSDFELPPLTIQPMVENAIRHGVRGRDKGLVQVLTRRDGGDHLILIRDNGKGFSESSVSSESGMHIGIKNVRQRVSQLCNGTLTIESRPGEGTAVLVRIPARENGRDERASGR